MTKKDKPSVGTIAFSLVWGAIDHYLDQRDFFQFVEDLAQHVKKKDLGAAMLSKIHHLDTEEAFLDYFEEEEVDSPTFFEDVKKELTKQLLNLDELKSVMRTQAEPIHPRAFEFKLIVRIANNFNWNLKKFFADLFIVTLVEKEEMADAFLANYYNIRSKDDFTDYCIWHGYKINCPKPYETVKKFLTERLCNQKALQIGLKNTKDEREYNKLRFAQESKKKNMGKRVNKLIREFERENR